jgi:hypothetical protein
LTNGTPYTFTVVATNSVGDSSSSSPSAAVTPSSPPAPAPSDANGQLTNGVMLENSLKNFTAPLKRGAFFKVRTTPE